MNEKQESTFHSVLEEWTRLDADAVFDWAKTFALMSGEEMRLREAGLWRTGGRTLLHALGLHHSEVHLCRGLAWLLTPDGWHGLGPRMLQGMLAELHRPADMPETVTVVTEEARRDTRADIVVRSPEMTLLIEAKVFAAEQSRQCDRLAELWADESPELVFLTRHGGPPTSAIQSREQWRPMKWQRVAAILAQALDEQSAPNPGAEELLQTLTSYGG